MSYEDRDWIREPERPTWSLRGLSPILAIIVVTTFAFLVQSAVANGSREGSLFIDRHLALSREGVMGGEIWQPLTYLLLHGGLGHIFWNMFFLWAFGSILLDLAAVRTFWITYLAGGVAGAGAWILWVTLLPPEVEKPVVGASGAITAVVVAAACRAPRFPIRLFLMPATIPLWLVALVYVAIDFIAALQDWFSGTTGRVAVQAHLGGAASAALLFLLARRGGGRPAPRPVWERTAMVGDDERLEPEPPRERTDEARVDTLLAKIHAWGMESLSEEEKAFLKRASEKYRGRRK